MLIFFIYIWSVFNKSWSSTQNILQHNFFERLCAKYMQHKIWEGGSTTIQPCHPLLYSLCPRRCAYSYYCKSLVFLNLTNIIEKSSNIYDVKLVYCEIAFQDGSIDTLCVPKCKTRFFHTVFPNLVS
jgi:hypothetical protein